VTLVDTNILMYAGGAVHSHRKPSLAFLEAVMRGSIRATLDAESLQEILHRYRSIGRWNDGEVLYDRARLMFPEVLAITGEVTDSARRLMGVYPTMVARDAIHAAVVEVYRLDSICSFDRDFDRIAGLKRIEP
jgi:predicted nucleic acid-binding protein